jgi:hypothetical protein
VLYVEGGGLYHLAQGAWRGGETYCTRALADLPWPINCTADTPVTTVHDRLPPDLDRTPICTVCMQAWAQT